MLHTSRRAALSFWDAAFTEGVNVLRYWKRMSSATGTTMSSRSIPRYVHGYIEGGNQSTQSVVRYYPYKQEMTVDGQSVPTFRDVIYAYYFPKEYNDDERVKYVSIKTGRTELEVAQEVYRMRRIKMYAAQLLRSGLRGCVSSIPQGADFSDLERRYFLAVREVVQMLGTSLYNTDTVDPAVMYSPRLRLGDCIDLIVLKQMRTSMEYILTDVVVHKSIPRSRLTHVRDSPREPLTSLEPCMYDFLRLRLAVFALIAKEEQYVVDHEYDCGHLYAGCLIHLYPSPTDVQQVMHEVDYIELDLDLARRWMQHYYEHYVAPHTTY